MLIVATVKTQGHTIADATRPKFVSRANAGSNNAITAGRGDRGRGDRGRGDRGRGGGGERSELGKEKGVGEKRRGWNDGRGGEGEWKRGGAMEQE